MLLLTIHWRFDMPKAKQPKEKVPCAIAEDRFFEKAAPIKIRLQQCDDKGEVLHEHIVVAFPQKNKSGSYGWQCSEEPTVHVDGVALRLQANMGLTIIGSKPGDGADQTDNS